MRTYHVRSMCMPSIAHAMMVNMTMSCRAQRARGEERKSCGEEVDGASA